MSAKNTKRLDAINSKIDHLLKAKSKLEKDFVNDMAQQIAKILVNKKAFNIDKSALLKKIETIIDGNYDR